MAKFLQSTKFFDKYKDLIGVKFNKLVVTDLPGVFITENTNKQVPAVEVKCDCGKIKITYLYGVKNGHIPSCGCVNKNWHVDKTKGSCNDLLNRYKYSAKKRGKEFKLSYRQFRGITSQNCHYCGSKPLQIRHPKNCQSPYIHNGIDRKDSDRGYTMDNCLPCCGICNRAKSNMSYSDFLSYLDLIVDKHSPQR
jgi:hypothetical protein